MEFPTHSILLTDKTYSAIFLMKKRVASNKGGRFSFLSNNIDSILLYLLLQISIHISAYTHNINRTAQKIFQELT